MINLTFRDAKTARVLYEAGIELPIICRRFEVNLEGLRALIAIANPNEKGNVWNLVQRVLDNREVG